MPTPDCLTRVSVLADTYTGNWSSWEDKLCQPNSHHHQARSWHLCACGQKTYFLFFFFFFFSLSPLPFIFYLFIYFFFFHCTAKGSSFPYMYTFFFPTLCSVATWVSRQSSQCYSAGCSQFLAHCTTAGTPGLPSLNDNLKSHQPPAALPQQHSWFMTVFWGSPGTFFLASAIC